MPATQSARNQDLPRRITQAQINEEKRKIPEQLEQQMRQAEKRLLNPELPLPRRAIPSPVLEAPSAEILPTRIKMAEPPPAIDLPTYNPSRMVAAPPSNVVALPTRNAVLPRGSHSGKHGACGCARSSYSTYAHAGFYGRANGWHDATGN